VNGKNPEPDKLNAAIKLCGFSDRQRKNILKTRKTFTPFASGKKKSNIIRERAIF
jgi:hypothetical protein